MFGENNNVHISRIISKQKIFYRNIAFDGEKRPHKIFGSAVLMF